MQKEFVYKFLVPERKDLTSTGFWLVAMVISLYLSYDNYNTPERMVKFMGARLEYPLTYMAFIALAGLFILFAIFSYFSMKSNHKKIREMEEKIAKTDKDLKKIICRDIDFTFYDKKEEKRTVKYDDVWDMWEKSNPEDKEDNHLAVFYKLWNDESDNGIFKKMRFEDDGQFNEFVALMREKCTKLEKN